MIRTIMAEACRLANQCKERNKAINQDENVCVFNVLCVFISLITILADLTTDILVFAEYCKDGYVYWALTTLIFILTPNILINVFSMRWFIIDKKSNLKLWITHGFLFGLLERYILFLRKIFACQNIEAVKTQKLISQRNDLSLLHFLYIFTGTIPQIILQTYAIVMLEENYYTKVFALAASNTSVIWGCATYIYSIMTFSDEKFQWLSLVLRLLWHFSMLLARISGIFLSTVIFGIWTLLPLGLHWIAMTFWIVIQNTAFCPNKIEETLYNVVMGFVYCFCYINLREGHTRYRLLLFYTLMVTQNFGSLFLYVLISDFERQKKSWSIAATVCIIMGTLFGMCAMIIYYRFFHSKGPIPWKAPHDDVELNNKVDTNNPQTTCNKSISLKYVRSFKSMQKEDISNKDSNIKSNTNPQNESDNADKKFLLDHWIARSGSPTFTSAPVGNVSIETSSIELFTVENTPQSINLPPKPNKKRTILSPTELTIKLSAVEHLESSIDKITSINVNLQKRRGICSSDELREDFANLSLEQCNIIHEAFSKTFRTEYSSEISHDTDGSNKKTSSDSIDMDLDLSFSDINSSDINTFNENIVQKLCLSALKNIKVGNQDADIENIQRIALDILKEMYAKKDKHKSEIHSSSLRKRDQDTPTEILSVHDYENICAVNIAREAWGLRSWNGYCDIENWLHDGSVVRDRRRDTLTSASTEISSCISQELKNAILTAPPFPRKPHTYSNVFIKFDKSNQDDYVNAMNCQSNDETYLAKPCMIDSVKDANQLEPILEELDDLGDIDRTSKKRINSESSLVATIDEIRKATATSSPRNLYHRTQVWDSPQFTESKKVENSLKRALWKEPSRFNSNNIMESLPEKENILDVHGFKYNPNKKELPFLDASVSVDLQLDDAENVLSVTTRKRQKNTCSVKTQMKKNIHKPDHHLHKPDHHLQDLSNRDIDFLWQLVSENSNSLPVSSTEDLSSNRISSSLLSLIQKDATELVVNSPVSKVSNVKKVTKSRPRRKFSILRERFEPKSSLNSDEEVLYHCSDNVLHTSDSSFINVKNNFDNKDEIQACVTKSQLSMPDEAKTNNTEQSVDPSLSKNIKEKRSIFMKQVLNPPKFNTKLRYKV